MKVTVTKLAKPIHMGDHHDKPMCWQVSGPGTEVQMFSTKACANEYAKYRRHSKDATEASRKFLFAPAA